jgi:hypothetical protein
MTVTALVPCPRPGCDGWLTLIADRTWHCRYCGHVEIREETTDV